MTTSSGGGLPRNRLSLVQGSPGAGKTTLALQFLIEGVRAGEPCLYITLSECRAEVVGVEEGLATPAADALIATLDAQPSWSALPLVVLTTGDDDHRLELLARLGLSLGVVTLLERPLRQARLVAAMRVALNARRRQYEVRALLEEREQREQVLRERAAKLRASEAQFRETADAAPAMLWVSDATLAWTYLSRSWYEYTGTKRGSGLGKG